MILDASRTEISNQPTVDFHPSVDTMSLEILPLLPADTPLSGETMAGLFGVGQRALNRMVQRGELPPGVKMAGRLVWTAGVVRQHIQKRTEEAAKVADEKRALKHRHLPHRKR